MRKTQRRGSCRRSARLCIGARLRTSGGLRIDAGFGAGDAVSRYYDPMLAKVIAHAETRGPR